MRNRLVRVSGVFDLATDWCAVGAAILIAYLMVSVSLSVVLRYVFNISVMWLLEVIGYCLVYMTFLAAAWIRRKDGHVCLEFVVDRLKPRARACLLAITSVIEIVVGLFLVCFGILTTLSYASAGSVFISALSPPKAAISVIVPFSGLLLLVQVVRKMCQRFRRHDRS